MGGDGTDGIGGGPTWAEVQQESKSLQRPQAGQDGTVRAEAKGKDVQDREAASEATRIKWWGPTEEVGVEQSLRAF